MKNRKNILVLFILVCFFLVGCVKEEKVNGDKKDNVLIGKWIADGTQIVSLGQNQDELEPYYLEFYDDKNFKLTMNDETIQGEYQVNEDNSVYLTTDMTVICNLNDKELDCNMYASKFIKE